ncbi:MAG: PQQ-binding-like beta-propeller repeat protein [Pirellulaceae bacterium]|nr:PQQ-binding-like beta-propeller repeat protein [Pirellulaceae bacterium]
MLFRFLMIMRLVCLFSLAVTHLETAVSATEHWPQWRGSTFDGQTIDQSELPTRWSDDSIVWRTRLPGIGQSTPIVWGQRLFVTSATTTGKQRSVHCLDAESGKIIWTQVITCADPAKQHRMNTYASASCVTDGTRVVACFGRAGIHCFDLDGTPLWSRTHLSRFQGPWGTAASPTIVDGLVIQNCDADQDAFLIAFDKQTGKTVWKTKRDDFRGWSTPFVIQVGDRHELILNGHRGIRGYDPETGIERWFCQSFNGRGAPTPVFIKGLLIVLNGKPGDIYAVQPGGTGDVTKTHLAWHTRRSGRDLPSPTVSAGKIFTVGLRGIATSYELETGAELWRERLGGIYAASPIVVDGKFLVLNENGKCFVIQPDSKLNIVNTNELESARGEMFRASIAPYKNRLILRSDRAMYCVSD